MSLGHILKGLVYSVDSCPWNMTPTPNMILRPIWHASSVPDWAFLCLCHCLVHTVHICYSKYDASVTPGFWHCFSYTLPITSAHWHCSWCVPFEKLCSSDPLSLCRQASPLLVHSICQALLLWALAVKCWDSYSGYTLFLKVCFPKSLQLDASEHCSLVLMLASLFPH